MYTRYPTFVQRDDGISIPLDPANSDYAAYLDWIAEGNTPDDPPTPTLPMRIASLLAGVDALLDGAAKTKGYDNIRSAALRAGYPGPFHDEGVRFATWMDGCYATCYQVLAQFQAGAIDEPDLQTLIGMLPTLETP